MATIFAIVVPGEMHTLVLAAYTTNFECFNASF
jgi:hypothetical protein